MGWKKERKLFAVNLLISSPASLGFLCHSLAGDSNETSRCCLEVNAETWLQLFTTATWRWFGRRWRMKEELEQEVHFGDKLNCTIKVVGDK